MQIHIHQELLHFRMHRTLPSRLQRLIALQTGPTGKRPSCKYNSRILLANMFVGLNQIDIVDLRFGDPRKDVLRGFGLYIPFAGVHFHHVLY
jgi:hypothetical protein